MRYWRVFWVVDGVEHASDPLPTWTKAEMYRRQVGGRIEEY
jgi:hypothetical protein